MSLEIRSKLHRKSAKMWLLTLVVTMIALAMEWDVIASLGFRGSLVVIGLIFGETMISVFAWRNWNEAEEKLQGAEGDLCNLRTIVEASQDAVIDLTADGLITNWSKGARQLYGYSAKQVFGEHFSMLFDPKRTHEAGVLLERVLQGKNVSEHETQHVKKDGKDIDVALTICPFIAGDKTMTSIVIRDITGRQRAAESLAQQAAAMKASMDGMAIINHVGVCVYLNDAYAKAFGYNDPQALIGSSWEEFYSDEELPRFKDRIMPAVWRDGSWRGEAVGKRRDDFVFPVEISISSVAGGGVVHVVRDISERKHAEDALRSISFKDELTGLFNRRGLLKSAARYFDFALRQKESLLLIFIDLDGMKRINDDFGHNEGDNALINTAAILKKSCGESDIIARLGGDEFTVLVTDSGTTSEQAVTRLNENLDAFNKEQQLAYKLSFSVGVAALNPGHMTCFDELLEKADQTMYEQKRNKKKRALENVPVEIDSDSSTTRLLSAGAPQGLIPLALSPETQLGAESDKFGTFDQAAIGMAVVAADGSWLQINDSLCTLLGYSEQELRGMSFQQVTHPDDLKRVQPYIDRVLEGQILGHQQEKRYIHKQGHAVWVTWNVSSLGAAKGETKKLFFQVQNISDRKAAEERLRQDMLTGLPNRGRFNDTLKLRASRVDNNKGKPFAVLFLDVDRFKLVNDSLGHSSGDQLLRQIADRITACMRHGDVVGRVGGDEFAVLLDDVTGEEEACSVAGRIQQELSMSFNLFGQEVYASVSIGITLSSDYFEQVTDMLRDAETAMHEAKSLGKARYEVFGRAMHGHVKSLLKMETDLRHATDRNEFFVQYQPVVALNGNKLIGFEALARWQHPEFGVISPLDFIPVAEETGQILAIGQIVLREACRQAREWQQKVLTTPPLFVSVNLSVKQFTQPDLLDNISALLAEFDLAPGCLKLEITESVFTQNVEAAVELLKQLRDLGVQLSIDDFGTGYSSLSYLHRFPINTLKIDRSFVTQMSENVENVEIVRTIVMLAQNLGMDVVAEGVETKEQLSLLRGLGCENGQGFLFSRPLGLEDVGGYITKGEPNIYAALGSISANFPRPALVA